MAPSRQQAIAALLALTLASSAIATPVLWSSFFGFAPNSAVCSVNLDTAQSIMQSASLEMLQAQGLSAIDEKRGIIYLVGVNEHDETATVMVGVSLASGRQVSKVTLPFTNEAFVGVGQFVEIIQETGDAIVIGRSAAVGMNHTIARVDPFTGSVKHLATLEQFIPEPILDVLGAPSTYDPHNQVVWYV